MIRLPFIVKPTCGIGKFFKDVRMHRHIRLIIFSLLIALLWTVPCLADVVERFETGSINWTLGKLSATGITLPADDDPRKIDCQKALAAAKTRAFQQLLEIVKAVRIDADSRVGDFAEKSDRVMAKLMDMVKEADIVRQEYLTNGTADVGVQMSLFGGFSQLVLPAEIEHVESVKPVNSKVNDIQGMVTSINASDYSGLIIDARGLGIKPAMTPRIYDENLNEVYGPVFVSRETAVQKGLCCYVDDMAYAIDHPSAGEYPLTVKGLRQKNGRGADIIISNADAQTLKSSSAHLAFLRQCNVIILVDADNPPPENHQVGLTATDDPE
ncbi:MAG: hypothetical protein R6U50_17675 [Desulfobacterales bacterium]